MNCPKCGKIIPDGTSVCRHCGYQTHFGGNTEFYQKAASTNVMGIKDVFSDVFKRHSKGDGESLFMAGTSKTTPHEADMLREWRKPWVFMWIIIIGVVLSLVLYLMSSMVKSYGAFMVVGSFVMPLAALMFYWEMNIPRNIPLYQVLLMFLAGGVASLFISMIFFQVVDTTYASFAAFCEEPAKLLAFLIFLRKPDKKYILNGILIGGAIGAGFGAMESVGYALDVLSQGVAVTGGDPNFQGAVNELTAGVVLLRGVLAPGMHVVWAALYGGALAMVKGNETLQPKHFADVRFWIYFGISIALHFVWNSGLSLLPIPVFGDLLNVLLMIGAWVILFFLINKGIKQVLAVSSAAGAHSAPRAIETAPKMAAPKAAANTPTLVGLTGAYQGHSIPLTRGDIVFGRDPSCCSIVLPQETAGISRRHCTLSFDGVNVFLCDDGSSYGTYLSGGQKLAPGVRVPLKSGSRFYLGGESALFEIRL